MLLNHLFKHADIGFSSRELNLNRFSNKIDSHVFNVHHNYTSCRAQTITAVRSWTPDSVVHPFSLLEGDQTSTLE